MLETSLDQVVPILVYLLLRWCRGPYVAVTPIPLFTQKEMIPVLVYINTEILGISVHRSLPVVYAVHVWKTNTRISVCQEANKKNNVVKRGVRVVKRNL
jgi:hypothetical protein